ncbi:tetratricopeptide repeat protein [Fulvivirga ligni]|uniref:tetratricopeptide repeat protein n=1 Tax=Fulvivirga ligni TaxID=2904246 RepID=UPI001F1C2AF2|nr:tetratricopeptide repeat protein [Fulvivirga ligni]UII21053.1 tetratricopeptide repeat protein [Fulvivirga ligni]
MLRISGFILIILSFFSTWAHGQYLDSLELELKDAKGKDRVNVLNELFIVHNQLNPEQALEYATSALELATEIDYPKGKAAALNNLGIIYKNQGVYARAVEFYIESLRISDEINDQKAEASTMNNLGTVYSLRGDYDKALIYFVESYEIFKTLGDEKRLVGALNNIGNAYNDNGKEQQALEYFNKAIVLSDRLGLSFTTSNPLNNIGNIYFYNKDYDQAISYYEKSLAVEVKGKNLLGQAQALSNIASTQLAQGQLAKAENTFLESEKLADSISAYPILELIYEGLSKVYAAQNKFEMAYKTRLNYDKIKDILYTEESSKKLAQLEVAIELQQKEKQLEVLRQQDAINSLQIKNSRIVILLSVMGVIILLGGVIVFMKLRKAKVQI